MEKVSIIGSTLQSGAFRRMAPALMGVWRLAKTLSREVQRLLRESLGEDFGDSA
jgi:hypothetical protein